MTDGGDEDPGERLAAWIEGRVAVIGIGNPLRGDDAAGSLVARRVEASLRVSVIDAEEVPENHLARVVGWRPDTIVLVDSVDLGSTPGSVSFLDRDQMVAYAPSTHRTPMGLLMSVLERETGARVFAIGIQPAHTEFLRPVSTAVMSSIDQVAGMLNLILADDRLFADGGAAASWEGGMSA